MDPAVSQFLKSGYVVDMCKEKTELYFLKNDWNREIRVHLYTANISCRTRKEAEKCLSSQFKRLGEQQCACKKKKKANSAFAASFSADLVFAQISELLSGSEFKTCFYTFGKYSLPWFPHRKQPCEVSDDPRARMRTINRKLLSSKLHPIIIGTENTHKQSQFAARHKVTDNMNGRPPRLCANLQRKSVGTTCQRNTNKLRSHRETERNLKRNDI